MTLSKHPAKSFRMKLQNHLRLSEPCHDLKKFGSNQLSVKESMSQFDSTSFGNLTSATMDFAVQLADDDVIATRKRKAHDEFVLIKVSNPQRIPRDSLCRRVRMLAGPGGLKIIISRSTMAARICSLYLFIMFYLVWICGLLRVCFDHIGLSNQVDMMNCSNNRDVRAMVSELLESSSKSSTDSKSDLDWQTD